MDAETEATSVLVSARKSTRSEVVEVVTRGERRRSWSDEQKCLIVAEATQPGAMVVEVARRWGIGTRCLSKKLSGAASDCVSDFAVVGVALGVEADVANRRPVADLA
jgi:hypothetical protein